MGKGCPGQGADHRRHPDGQDCFSSAVSLSHLCAATSPRPTGPAQTDTHQQMSAATTAVQVTQQERGRLVCAASSCRQQHAQTR